MTVLEEPVASRQRLMADYMAHRGLGRRRVSDADDFVVSIHALERFEERFPDEWSNDHDVGQTIYAETMDAFESGRVATMPPLEFADNDITLWADRKSKIAWTPDKMRGYVIVEGYEGMTVATVLLGQPTGQARSKLFGPTRSKRR